MSENSRGILFRKRNVLGVALAAGIGLGIYLGQFKGFGLGGSHNWGIGSSDHEAQVSVATEKQNDATLKFANRENDEESSLPVSDIVRVVIDDHDFLLRTSKDDSKDVKISLPKLIQRIKQAPGDTDGLRVRIYRKTTARASTEENLKNELAAAGIEETAIFWVPTPVK